MFRPPGHLTYPGPCTSHLLGATLLRLVLLFYSLFPELRIRRSGGEKNFPPRFPMPYGQLRGDRAFFPNPLGPPSFGITNLAGTLYFFLAVFGLLTRSNRINAGPLL